MTSVLSQQSRDDVDSELMMIGDDLQVTASTLEVDYDKNLTELYQAITDQDWTLAASICKKDPIQAECNGRKRHIISGSCSGDITDAE